MKKDIEWLKREIHKELDGWRNVEGGIDGDGINNILNIIDQLNEPEITLDKAFEKVAESYLMTKEEVWRHLERLEAHGRKVIHGKLGVLSQEWIDKYAVHVRGLGDIIEAGAVENLLVPRQELPLIPKFVADFIEETKKQYKTLVFAITHIYNENEIGASPNKEEKRIYQWMEAYDNEEIFARAWLDGFTVETEQKYYVMNNDNRMMLVRMMDGKTITEADPFKLEDMYEGEKESHRLTEQEIKDYDPRYWAFRKPVEELEE